MSQILLAGTATLDIVNTVDHYPQEDDEVRASASRVASGGNAANCAAVLASLGHQAHLCAVLADDASAASVRDALRQAEVDLRHCPQRSGATPTSYITLSAANGSRTIIHHRDLPELESEDIARIPLEDYDWLHFEGRNVATTAHQIRLARRRLRDQPISVEIEKPRPGIQRLFAYADVLLFSRAFALANGFTAAEALLSALRPQAPQAILVCAWGEDGAWALAPGDRRRFDCVHAPAFRTGPVVDTLGAGDTFNAGIIDALCAGAMLEEALAHANRLAGLKVAREGLL
ncbi:PfkB family carbohydrate kinase [Acidihalobacter prosperus]